MSIDETTTEIPLPTDLKAPAKPAPRPVPPVVPALPATPAPPATAPELSVGAFYAEHRALVDARRAPLARLGILPQHATALAMPDLSDAPLMPPARGEDMPEQAPSTFAVKPLPKLPGVNASADEE